MSYTWKELDQLLRWNKRSEPDLPARLVHEENRPEGRWAVLARRGQRGSGNEDIVAEIVPPDGNRQTIESLKQLVDDVLQKARENRDWMRGSFMPALVRVVVLGENPDSALPHPPELRGYPARVLLNALQVIALSEGRKYRHAEPFGGRYLLVRVCAGVVWGVWSEDDVDYAALKQDAVAVLRARTGVREPTLGLVLSRAAGLKTVRLSACELEALSL